MNRQNIDMVAEIEAMLLHESEVDVYKFKLSYNQNLGQSLVRKKTNLI